MAHRPSPPTDSDLLIALNTLPRLSRAALCRLGVDLSAWRNLPAMGGAARAASELGMRRTTLERALAIRADAAHRAQAERLRAAAEGAQLVTLADPTYPAALLDHPLPPPVLAIRTDRPDALAERWARPAVAIVGSRKMSAYGAEVARHFAGDLSRAGVVVVSGFALGVDRAAHRAALEAGGLTVAVLGCGLDIDYPRGSRQLADRIAAAGALVSEFSFGTTPRAWHFPIRNRAIAALARATLVVEAKPRSGSLVTAHRALELGREVFAVPGRIVDDSSLGTNELIADGATPALSVDDVLDALSLPRPPRREPAASSSTTASTSQSPPATPRVAAAPQISAVPPPPGLGGRLVALLVEDGDCGPEPLAERAGAPIDRVLGSLLELELEGWVDRLPGPRFAPSPQARASVATPPSPESSAERPITDPTEASDRT